MRKNLQAARKAAGLTQQVMAEKLGVTVRQYQRIEAGVSHGSYELWDLLEDTFNVHQRVLREIHRDTKASQPKHQKDWPSQLVSESEDHTAR